MCLGFRINAVSVAAIAPAREEKRCWDLLYIHTSANSNKTIMWLFNRNHNSSLNGACLCVWIQSSNTLPHHHSVYRLSSSFFGLNATSILTHARTQFQMQYCSYTPPIMTIWNTRKTQTIIYYTTIWCAVAAAATITVVAVVVIQCL